MGPKVDLKMVVKEKSLLTDILFTVFRFVTDDGTPCCFTCWPMSVLAISVPSTLLLSLTGRRDTETYSLFNDQA
jgi:hypothetical protein